MQHGVVQHVSAPQGLFSECRDQSSKQTAGKWGLPACLPVCLSFFNVDWSAKESTHTRTERGRTQHRIFLTLDKSSKTNNVNGRHLNQQQLAAATRKAPGA